MVLRHCLVTGLHSTGESTKLPFKSNHSEITLKRHIALLLWTCGDSYYKRTSSTNMKINERYALTKYKQL